MNFIELYELCKPYVEYIEANKETIENLKLIIINLFDWIMTTLCTIKKYYIVTVTFRIFNLKLMS